jgi:hypothetical protein
MTGNRFRARADKCFRAANSVADPERKLAHLDLADRWLRLATQIDKMDAETRHGTPLVPLQAGHPRTRRTPNPLRRPLPCARLNDRDRARVPQLPPLA